MTHDIPRQLSNSLHSHHRQLLQLLISDMPLKQALHQLIAVIEQEAGGMLASVLLMSADKLHLVEGAAPNLPDFYNQAIDGVAIGEGVGSCGTAAFTGQRVIVADINTHPYWADYKSVALAANLQACWSQPIEHGGSVLGTFALYYGEPQSPDEHHLQLIEDAASLAKVLIEKHLSKQQEQLSSRVFETSSMGIIIANGDADIEYTNPALTQMCGYSAQELHGNNPKILQSDLQSQLFYRSMWHDIKIHGYWQGQLVNRKKSGELFYVEQTISKTQDSDGGEHYIATIIDVTGKRDAVKQLGEKEQALEQALGVSQAKSRFLANMSHELRTPLNGIIGMADLLLDTPIDDQQQQYLQALNFSASTLLTVINDVLDISKVSEGKLTLEDVEFNFLKFLESLLIPYRLQASNEIEFSASIDADVPQWLAGDPVRLHQIIGNLLNNAFKFTPAGSISLLVNSRADPQGELSLSFVVADSGIGMSAEQCDKAFSAFEQADDSTTRQFGGTGLGLSICRELVSMFDGDITLESELGVGSTFTATVKLRQLGNQFVETAAVNELDCTGLTLLLVEDNPVNVQVCAGMLKKLGLEVTITGNGQQAVSRYCDSGEQFDIVLMDCEMPLMDGYQATAAIRKWEREQGVTGVPICALTAHAMAEQIEKCIASGMDYHLAKPLTRAALSTTLSRIVSERRLRNIRSGG